MACLQAGPAAWSPRQQAALAALSALVLGVMLHVTPPARADTPAADLRLTLEAPLAITLQDEQQIGITQETGLYAAGTLQVLSGQISAEFTNARGESFRHLPLTPGATTRFHVTAPQGGVSLRLTGQGQAQIRLNHLTAKIAADQVPPPIPSPKLAALAQAEDRPAALAAFWHEVTANGAPLVEDFDQDNRLVTFLWRGQAQNLRLFGGPTAQKNAFTRLGDSDLWYLSQVVPADARFSYQIAANVPEPDGSARDKRTAILATAAQDPLNPVAWPPTAADPWARSSVLRLHKTPPDSGWPVTADMPQLIRFPYKSHAEAPLRSITLSLPEQTQLTSDKLVVALFLDGEQMLNRMQMPQVLAGLTAAGQLPPVLGVYVPSLDNTQRAAELPGNPVFHRALAEDLLPLIAQKLGLPFSPARSVVIGASFGGIAASRIVQNHPRTFGAAIAISPSYWWSAQKTETDLSAFAADIVRDRFPVSGRLVIAAGTFEMPEDGGIGIYPDARLVAELMQLKGHDVIWHPYSGGHDWYAWQGEITRGLQVLFGKDPGHQGQAHQLPMP